MFCKSITMKKKFTYLLFLLGSLAYSQTFNDGYSNGYKEGYCFGKSVGCIAPVTPIAPIPPIGKNTYQDGYNIGFTDGKAKGGKDESGNTSLSAEKIDYSNSGSNEYSKYKDANKYQSGGVEESKMIDNAVQNLTPEQAFGQAIYIARMNNHKKKLSENTLLYEIEPTVELAFDIAKSANTLLGADMYDDRFGPILKEHKLLVVKYKGNYKKYRKALKKGKEKIK